LQNGNSEKEMDWKMHKGQLRLIGYKEDQFQTYTKNPRVEDKEESTMFDKPKKGTAIKREAS
jgi:hypothetical protein